MSIDHSNPAFAPFSLDLGRSQISDLVVGLSEFLALGAAEGSSRALDRHVLCAARSGVHVRKVGDLAGAASAVLVFTCGAALRGAAAVRLHGLWIQQAAGCGDVSLIGLALVVDNIAHDPCNLEELRLFKLPQDGLKLRLLNQIGQLEVVLCARLEVSRRIACLLLQSLCPARDVAWLVRGSVSELGVSECNPHRHIERRRCQQGRQVLIHLRIKKGKLEQILRQEENNAVCFRNF